MKRMRRFVFVRDDAPDLVVYDTSKKNAAARAKAHGAKRWRELVERSLADDHADVQENWNRARPG